MPTTLQCSRTYKMCSWWGVVWWWFYRRLERQRYQCLSILTCYLFPGCGHGDYCIPAGSRCPHVCHVPSPVVCTAEEVWCTNGTSLLGDGCSQGNHCLPKGSVCPPVCHDPAPVICGDGEISCDGGSTNGCHKLNTCHPAGLTIFTQFIYYLDYSLFWRNCLSTCLSHPSPSYLWRWRNVLWWWK